jgi:pimeloyl-ACP methyl ester carboxylesterase
VIGVPVPDAPPAVPPEDLQDLQDRLRNRRPTPMSTVLPSTAGVDLGVLDELLGRWADGYDWSRTEARIRSLPWEVVETGEGPLRMIVRRAEPTAPVVMLLHGWPDSVLRFERVLPRLHDVTAIVPAFPGYPFAAPVEGNARTAAEIAGMLATAIDSLGCGPVVVSAGDVGCDVAEVLAAEHPELVCALHLTDVSQYHYLAAMPDDASPAERAYERRGHEWQAAEGGYMHLQRTKPRTVAVGLNDSPAGLAAWLLEKYASWTDNGGDVFAVFTPDELLDWISAYWLHRCIGTSFTPYALSRVPKATPGAPTVFSIYPRDLVNAPRAFAERIFDVRAWHEHPHGGHFAAWEHPGSYEDGIREAIGLASSS